MAKKPQRSLVLLEVYGTVIHIDRAAEIAGCQTMTIHNRLVAGWDYKPAIFTPLTAAEKRDEQEINGYAKLSGTKFGVGDTGPGHFGGRSHPADVQESQYHGGRFNRGEW